MAAIPESAFRSETAGSSLISLPVSPPSPNPSPSSPPSPRTAASPLPRTKTTTKPTKPRKPRFDLVAVLVVRCLVVV
ncbi:hypothetical protein Scep_021324 [Stephania cephalantha]|uniref:Uncharacterized protein n=1 Tax=Stephania cephalantha TaxID=152367 RepID=A0AAP0F5V2_9MAGN